MTTSPEARFTENGFAFTADLTGGQKTGFYCDQRQNRQLAETFAGDADVLDLFSHSGAFTLYALRGGARSGSRWSRQRVSTSAPAAISPTTRWRRRA